MPNWCYNYVTFEHTDPEMIEQVVKAARAEKLFETFIPMPDRIKQTSSPSGVNQELMVEFGASNWYDWSLTNWGTKWDARVTGDIDVFEDGKGVLMYFETAWSPPIAFFDAMKQLGFTVNASYTEEGMGFAGIYENGTDHCFELGQLYEMTEADAEQFLSEMDNEDLRIVVTEEYYRYLEMREEEDDDR